MVLLMPYSQRIPCLWSDFWGDGEGNLYISAFLDTDIDTPDGNPHLTPDYPLRQHDIERACQIVTRKANWGKLRDEGRIKLEIKYDSSVIKRVLKAGVDLDDKNMFERAFPLHFAKSNRLAPLKQWVSVMAASGYSPVSAHSYLSCQTFTSDSRQLEGYLAVQ
jgi:hypothetical protein